MGQTPCSHWFKQPHLMSQMGFVQTEPRAEFGLSCLFRLRNLDSKSPLIFWLAGWVSEHSNSGKPRQMVTWITVRQVWLSWYFPWDKAGGCSALWWNMAGQDVSTFQGKWKSDLRVRQGKGGFWGQPEMLSHWSSSALREGWEDKTRQVGLQPQTAKAPQHGGKEREER